MKSLIRKEIILQPLMIFHCFFQLTNMNLTAIKWQDSLIVIIQLFTIKDSLFIFLNILLRNDFLTKFYHSYGR